RARRSPENVADRFSCGLLEFSKSQKRPRIRLGKIGGQRKLADRRECGKNTGPLRILHFILVFGVAHSERSVPGGTPQSATMGMGIHVSHPSRNAVMTSCWISNGA